MAGVNDLIIPCAAPSVSHNRHIHRAHPAPCPIGTGSKRSEREAPHSPQSSSEVELYLHSAIRLHDAVFN
jgi:hypothetical protein